jgi:hypothetical protein
MNIRRRSVTVVLALVVVGWAASLLGGSSGAALGPVATATPTPTPTPTPTATAPTPIAREATAALDRVQRAFDAGDARLLCRPGALVDPAVIRQQNAQSGGCEAEAETLIGDESQLKLEVRSVAAKRDLATVTVTTARGTTAHVDLIRSGGSWLLSFSDADDPLPVLAGVA